MKILALDPASLTTGYAVLEHGGDMKLLEAGTITATAKLEALARTEQMYCEVQSLLHEIRPDVIAIEVADGRQRTGKKRRSSSLPIWGQAVGMVWGCCLAWRNAHFLESTIIPIGNTQWTENKGKLWRQAQVRVYFPKQYDPEADTKGLDVSDAVALGIWVSRRITSNKINLAMEHMRRQGS